MPDDAYVCCALGVCCPPLSQEQSDALAHEMLADKVCGHADEAQRIARWMLKHFDLAPAGSLGEFKREIARMVREKDNGPK